MKYLAHLTKDKQKEQTILEHAQGTARLAEAFAEKFSAGEFGWQCGIAHDIGKYSPEFQQRIRGANIKVDHSTYGAKVLFEMKDSISALCVAGHHTGLPNFGAKNDSGEKTTLVGRVHRELCDAGNYRNEISLRYLSEPENLANLFEMSFFIRMIFSCLVDADYLDTENFMKGKLKPRRQNYAPMDSLNQKLNEYIHTKHFDDIKSKNPINRIRAEVLMACVNKAERPDNLFTLTVPTGGGKTISSLAFALKHALKNGKDRIIYVVPYCSIIDQTVEVFSSILGAESVLAHYSGADYNAKSEKSEDPLTKSGNTKKYAAENWDMPIVVTTAVQFFESLYGSRPSKCRKLHNIANSVVIFDEGQALPLDFLTPCMEAIQQLLRHYRATVLFMSATQPAFDQLLVDEQKTPLDRTEIFPDITYLNKRLSRNQIVDLDKLSGNELTERLNRSRQLLCIMNTRKNAAEVYDQLDDPESAYLLTTLLTPRDRGKILKEIKKDLKNGKPCRVISTNLIEAGVDIDFPVVFRESAGIDSLIQAAGRCNRENQRKKEESFVYYFQNDDLAVPDYLTKNRTAMETAVEKGVELSAPQTIEKYFETLYYLGAGKDKRLDKHHIIKAFLEGKRDSWLPFRTVANEFHLIEDHDNAVYIPCAENIDLIKKLRNGDATRQDYRLLGKDAASVPRGMLKSIKTKQIDDSSFILLDSKKYDKRTGLKIY